MKLKNRQIVDFTNSGVIHKKLPARLAYAIMLNAKNIEAAGNAYSMQHSELVKKYGERDEHGKVVRENCGYRIADVDGWNKEITELLETEAEVNITTVSSKVLEKCDEPGYDKLSATDLFAMGFMIED